MEPATFDISWNNYYISMSLSSLSLPLHFFSLSYSPYSPSSPSPSSPPSPSPSFPLLSRGRGRAESRGENRGRGRIEEGERRRGRESYPLSSPPLLSTPPFPLPLPLLPLLYLISPPLQFMDCVNPSVIGKIFSQDI